MTGLASATAIVPSGGSWRGEVESGWDIFGNTNGGYLMAMTARAMSGAAGGRTPVTMTAHFTRPVRPGPVVVATEVVKEGRTFTTVRAVLTTGEGTHLAALGTLAAAEARGGEVTLVDSTLPDLPPPHECVRLQPAEDAPLPPPMMGKVEVWIHPEDADSLLGRGEGTPRIRGWFRPLDGETIDSFALLVAADAFPPAVFNAHLPLAWTPTLEMTTHVRADGASGWLRCQFTTRFVTGGYLEEDGELWDEQGRLVAQSRQLALVPR